MSERVYVVKVFQYGKVKIADILCARKNTVPDGLTFKEAKQKYIDILLSNLSPEYRENNPDVINKLSRSANRFAPRYCSYLTHEDGVELHHNYIFHVGSIYSQSNNCVEIT